MRLDTANRSFFTLVGVALVPYVVVVFAGCGVVAVAAYRVLTQGLHGVTPALLPAGAVTLVVLVGTGLAASAWMRQAAATTRLVARVQSRARPVPDRLHAAAGGARLAARVDLIDDEEPFSFAYGLTRPRVVVSTGLLDTASDAELGAVLAHERHHVANRDPLKLVVAKALSGALFFLPALKSLRTRYAAASELAADRRVLHAHDRSVLAAALYRVVRGPRWDELSTAAAIGGPELLDVRLTQLETGEEPALASLPMSAVVTTAVALAVLAVVFVVTVVVLAPNAMGSM